MFSLRLLILFFSVFCLIFAGQDSAFGAAKKTKQEISPRFTKYSPNKRESYWALDTGVAITTEHLGVAQVDVNSSGLGPQKALLPFVTAEFLWITRNFNPFYFGLDLATTLPYSGEGEGIKKMTHYALLKAHLNLYRRFNAYAGLGLYFNRLWGTEETLELDNGTKKDKFFLPPFAKYSQNLVTVAGLQVPFMIFFSPTTLFPDLRVRAEITHFNTFHAFSDQYAKSYNFLIGLSYYGNL